MNYEPFTSIENPTLAHFRHFSSLFTNLRAYKALHLSRNLYKSPLFMQNKPNVKYSQINVNSYIKSKYEKLDTWLSGKNKANSNPIKPNLKKAKMNVNLYIIEDYRKKDDFVVRINKPNFQNAQNERKLNFNKGLQKKRLFSSPKNKPNSNPISKGQNELRAYLNNRVVMRPSEKFEAKAAGQKCSEAWFSPRREHFWPTTQASGFAAGRNRAGYLDRLLKSLAGKSGHTPAHRDLIVPFTRNHLFGIM